MLAELAILIRLQDIDNQLQELDDEKGDLPEQLEKLRGIMNLVSKELETLDATLQLKNEDKKNLQKEIRLHKEQFERSQSVIFNVKTSKEYDAVTAEIEQSKSRIMKTEQQLDLVKNAIAIVDSERQGKQVIFETNKKEYEIRDKEMRERLGATQDRIQELKQKREREVAQLKKPVLAHYERIRKIRDGVGVSHLVGDACSYCFSVLPPKRKSDIRRMDDMILCEVCGCILVSEEFAEQLDRGF